MNISMDGKQIKSVCWTDTESEQGRCLPSGLNGCRLYLSATYHGDRDEFWVVAEKDGHEIARHNIKYIESIEWEQPKEDGDET